MIFLFVTTATPAGTMKRLSETERTYLPTTYVLNGRLQWSHLSSSHPGINRSVDFFRQYFYSSLTLTGVRSIVDACGSRASKQSDSGVRELISSLAIPYCTRSLHYMDFIQGLPRFGGSDTCLVVTCGLSRFTSVCPCTKKTTGEQTVKILVEQWFEPYGTPKEVHSDEDVDICSDIRWYKRVLNALNVYVTTGMLHTHTSNPLCERQNRVLEPNLRIPIKQKRNKNQVWLLSWAVLTMDSQRSSPPGFTPHELFHGRRPCLVRQYPLSWGLQEPRLGFIGGQANMKHVLERELNLGNDLRRPASFGVGYLVLVHHLRLPSWPRNRLQDPYFGPYCSIWIDESRIHVRCSPRLGSELLCAPTRFRHYHSLDNLSWDDWRLCDKEVEEIDLQNAASPEEAGELESMTATEMAVDVYYVVAGTSPNFLTLWKGYGVSEAAWEPLSAFIQPDGGINPICCSYLAENNEGQRKRKT